MSRKLDDLDPDFRGFVVELIARIVEKGIAVVIVDTLRTPGEQAEYIRRGVSWTWNSKHLPQEPHGKSWAIDLAPYEVYRLHGRDKIQWDKDDPAWQVMGELGEKLGMRWGGRWGVKDMGHFEFNPARMLGWETT